MTANPLRAPARRWSSLARLFLESGLMLVCAAALQIEAMLLAEARAVWAPLPVLTAGGGLLLLSIPLFDEGGRIARSVGLCLGLGTVTAVAFAGVMSVLVILGSLSTLMGVPGLSLIR